MKPWMLLALAAACGGSRTPSMDPIVLTTGAGLAQTERPVWIVGFARNAGGGPIVEAGDLVVTCGTTPWADDVAGRAVVVAGTLTLRGEEVLLSPCVTPPEGDDGLIAAEQAVFTALARRDGNGLASLVAPEFVLRMPGQPDVSRQAFLDATASIPGEIVSVEGEHVVAHRAGDTGIVRGTQLARVKVDGKVIEDRGHFLDVFVRRDGRWIMTLALNVSAAP